MRYGGETRIAPGATCFGLFESTLLFQWVSCFDPRRRSSADAYLRRATNSSMGTIRCAQSCRSSHFSLPKPLRFKSPGDASHCLNHACPSLRRGRSIIYGGDRSDPAPERAHPAFRLRYTSFCSRCDAQLWCVRHSGQLSDHRTLRREVRRQQLIKEHSAEGI